MIKPRIIIIINKQINLNNNNNSNDNKLIVRISSIINFVKKKFYNLALETSPSPEVKPFHHHYV